MKRLLLAIPLALAPCALLGLLLSDCSARHIASSGNSPSPSPTAVREGLISIVPYDDDQEHLIRIGVVLPGSAKRHGLRVGDLILSIDGHKAKGNDVDKLLFGPFGARRTVTVQRGTDDPFSTTLELTDELTDPKRQIRDAFYAIPGQVDHNISCSRVSNSPYKFIGKVVELKGSVEAPVPNQFSLACDDGDESTKGIDVTWSKAQGLEQGATVDVIGVVYSPVYGDTEKNGVSTGSKARFATVMGYFVNGKGDPP